MEFTFARRAWEPAGPPDEPRSPALGLHAPGRFDAVFDLERCVLPGPRAVQALSLVRDFARAHRLEAYRSREDTGLLRHLSVREGQNTGDLLLALVVREQEPRLTLLGPLLAESVPGLTGAVVLVNRTRATIARGEMDAVLCGQPRFRERLLDLTFELHALSFFQTNTRAAEKLVSVLRSLVQDLPGHRLLDLYCGAGTLALSLAGRFEQVLGIEQVPEAIEDARANARANGLLHPEFQAADVEEWIRTQPAGAFDGVVVDPPRAGLHPRALARLPELAPRWIVYVSCNPATLARDAAGLRAAGYRPESLQVIDLFPHTAHVESILLFRREGPLP
jgi:23S rRNA (uracil1939-C5)-methyltransferase